MMFLKRHNFEIEMRSTFDAGYSAELKTGGGKTQVPCLKITSGEQETWMYESDDIVRYLDEQLVSVWLTG